MIRLFALSIALISLAGCSNDPNSEPKFSNDSGLPSNCRSYIQRSVDSWRAGEYESEEIINALERNCGMNGHLWDN